MYCSITHATGSCQSLVDIREVTPLMKTDSPSPSRYYRSNSSRASGEKAPQVCPPHPPLGLCLSIHAVILSGLSLHWSCPHFEEIRTEVFRGKMIPQVKVFNRTGLHHPPHTNQNIGITHTLTKK